jgi:subtilisin-like proprotein convertase family protein
VIFYPGDPTGDVYANTAITTGITPTDSMVIDTVISDTLDLMDVPCLSTNKYETMNATNNGDGSFTVEYTVEVENCGNIDIDSLQIFDDLTLTFNDADTFFVNGVPESGGLLVNANFDGDSDMNLLQGGQTLSAGAVGAVTFEVIFFPGNLTGDVYVNTSITTGITPTDSMMVDTAMTDTLDIIVGPCLTTTKSITMNAVNNGDGSFTVEYSVEVENCGNIDIDSLQIFDDLTLTFNDADSFMLVGIPQSGDLIVNTAFDGVNDMNLLPGTETLEPGDNGVVTFGVIFYPGNTVGDVYINTSITTGVTPTDSMLIDTSITPPLDIDLDICLNTSKFITMNPLNNGDGSFTMEYTIEVENCGNVDIDSLQITDDLATIFGAMDSFVVNGAPESGDLLVNTGFDGDADMNLLIGTETLQPGDNGSVTFELILWPGGAINDPYVNIAITTGITPTDSMLIDITLSDTLLLELMPCIDVQKFVSEFPTLDVNGIHHFQYTIRVENCGNVALDSIQVTDDLAALFANVDTFYLEGQPAGSLAPNVNFDGVNDINLLSGTETLEPGIAGDIMIDIAVNLGANGDGAYNNIAIATGVTPIDTIVSDTIIADTVILGCFVSIICPDVSDTITQDNDAGWCNSVVNLPAAIPLTCAGAPTPDIEFMLQGVGVDEGLPLNTWIVGQPHGYHYNVGITRISIRAISIVGISDTCEIIVNIEDKEFPVAVCQDIFLNVDDDCMVTITPESVDGGSSDNCGIDTMLISRDGINFVDSITFMAGDLLSPFVQITLYMVDTSGNVSICVATVTVLDVTQPEVLCQDDITVNTEWGVCYGTIPNVLPPLDTMDNCSPILYLDQIPEPGLLFGAHHQDSLEVFVIVSDIDGNLDTCSLFVHLNDNEPPEFINCPRPDIVSKALPGMCGAFVNFSLPVALDNCEIDTLIQTDPTGLTSGDMFPIGTTILEYKVFDVAGNMDTCTIKIIVNDEQDPTIVCPDDRTVTSDPGMCGAVVDSIAPGSLSDNCLTTVTYSITGEGDPTTIIAAGIGDASGVKFGCGTSTVTYRVSDVPVLVFSEVTHDVANVNGGTNPLPASFVTTSGDDYVEITNFGPAAFDLSCLIVERFYGDSVNSFLVPGRFVLPVGEVLTLHYGDGTDDPASYFFNVPAGDLTITDGAVYVMSYKGLVLDVLAVNGMNPIGVGVASIVSSADWTGQTVGFDGGAGALRQWAWDSNSAQDFIATSACDGGSIGSLNPGLMATTANGDTTALQSLPTNVVECSFTITTTDDELPACGSLASRLYSGATNLGSTITGGILTSEINVTDNFIVGDVNIVDILGTHTNVGDLTFKISSPSGTSVVLGSGLCPMDADFDFTADSDTLTSITTAMCNPLGQGGIYGPEGDLAIFNGEPAFGTWTLTIADAQPADDGSLTNWNLELFERIPYQQSDTSITNMTGFCFAPFTWLHPELIDNCAIGTIEVTFETLDGIVVPNGGTVVPGSEITEFFVVGTTEVIYTLTDKSGNVGTCSFFVTIVDDEDPVVACPSDITVSLTGGECSDYIHFNLGAMDNCSIDSIISIPASGSEFEIGTTTVMVIATDASGNMDTCFFDVTVNPYTPIQNDMACNDQINVSLNAQCMFVVNADMILEGDDYYCYEDYCIEISDSLGNVVPDNTFTLDHVGNCFTVTITDCLNSGATCWGTVCVEKKNIPEMVCPADTIIACNIGNDTSVTGVPEILTCEISYVLTYSDSVVEYTTCDSIVARIWRTWKVTNASGVSASCVQHITVEKFNLNQIGFPQDYIHGDAFSCEDVNADPTIVGPDNTGWPTLSDQYIFGDHYCEVEVGYWDERLIDANCPTAYTLLRNWVILDECLDIIPGVNPRRHIQRIKVSDKNPPSVVCPANMTVSTGFNDCYATVDLPVPQVTDACAQITDFRVEVSSGALYNPFHDIWYVSNLQVGTHTVTYHVQDACRNKTQCSFTITVVDDIPPVAICDVNTQVSLGSDGIARIDATTFDDFSYDNCFVDRIQVRRQITGPCANNGDDSFWKDYEEFCCEDIRFDVNGDAIPVIVELGVWDLYGNMNTCWVNVFVEDKLNPVIIAPDDISISCDFKFDLNNLDIFGQVAFNQSSRESIIIDDPDYVEDCLGQIYVGPSVVGLDGYAVDNCAVTVSEIDNINVTCGSGVITRIFTATDPYGRTASAIQRITIISCNPFYIVDTDSRCRDRGGVYTTTDDVEWPCDITLDGCSGAQTDPAFTGTPAYDDDKCGIVTDTFSDEVFTIVPDACFKILRTWSIIDWCQTDPGTGLPLRWDYVQTIKVIDEEGPIVTPADPGCDSTSTSCTGYTNLKPIVLDCTPAHMLNYWWRVDAYNDGIGILPGGFDFEGQTADPSANFPYGIHRILWVIEDMCGNRTTTEYEFEVEDCKKPSPVCINGLSSVVMPSSGQITVWAVDFDASSFDNCDQDLDFRIWYNYMDSTNYPDQSHNWQLPTASSTGAQVLNDLPTGAIFYCEALGNGISRTFTVRLYVVDDAGNWDYCTTSITIDDNDDVCPDDEQSIRIAGHIANEYGEVVDQVFVRLTGGALGMVDITKEVDEQGTFIFSAEKGHNWVVEAEKPDNYLNGVTAQDLSLIQRHIAGIGDLESHYKLLASDANADGDLDIRDVLELRKLLLGIYDELPNNSSWRMIDLDYNFDGINNYSIPAAAYQNGISYQNVNSSHLGTDFVAVKVGDVDGDAVPNSFVDGETRSGNEALKFMMLDASFDAGDIFTVNVTSDNFDKMTAYQLTFGFDPAVLEFVEVGPGALTIGDGNVGRRHHDRGLISSVWYNETAKTVAKTDDLFTITFRAKQHGQLSQVLNVGSTVTEALAFSDVRGRTDVNLVFTSKSGETSGEAFALFQNSPNPFDGETQIGYILPEDAAVVLRLFDGDGKDLGVINTDGRRGYNEITLKRNIFPADVSHVVYYQLQAEGYLATKKMIIVE